MNKVKDLDLYKLLEINFEADEATIRKAYRKKALKCHPDKNPDDPKAAEIFHQLSQALTVLTDPEARKAYDNVLKAKQATQIRHQQLDAKRQKLKEQLEERERAARESELYNRQRTDEEKLEREIERLRKEGAKQLEEEQERMRQQLFEEERQRANSSDQQNRNAGPAKIKVRWSGGNYDREMLKRIFSKFGDVLEVVVLPGKKKGGEGGSGLVEMSTKQAATDAANIERGFADHPLKIKLLDSGEDKHSKVSNVISSSSSAQKVAESFQDYETLVMRQLRQQEERKRLIEQMLKDEEANE